MTTEHLNPTQAERSILCAVFHAPQWLDAINLTESDFYDPRYGGMWDAFSTLRQAGTAPDPVTVGNIDKRLVELLPDIVTLGVPASNAEHYAAVIRDAALRRRTLATVTSLTQKLNDPTIPTDAALAEVENQLTRFGGGDLDAVASRLETLDEFLDRPRPPKRWVIPDLLTVGDRVIVTGAEGYGKSVFIRTIAVMVACGLHPFNLRSIPPQRVLLVDCENPEEIMADVLGDLRKVARNRGRTPEDRMMLVRYPQGLDLSSAKDRLELHRVIMMTNPSLLLIGPAYKLYVGGSNSREEDLARQVTSALDGLREEFGFALMLEHHSPHASGDQKRTVRPIGSSLWMRWPEFGIGLTPEEGTQIEDRRALLKHWRGARADRPWPTHLVAGGEGSLPWIDKHSLARAA